MLYNILEKGGSFPMDIQKRVDSLLKEVPPGVTVVAATKTRSAEEIMEVIDSGVKAIGENYVQEAESKFRTIGKKADWHMIGHIQKNKADKAFEIFDMVETLDNIKLAEILNRSACAKGIIYPVLIEINSGREKGKSGVFPEEAVDLITGMSKFHNLKIQGLMTMGPFFENPEDIRPFYRLVRRLFEELKTAGLPNSEMKYLSMGMSDTWRIAIEEGASIIRLGTTIFGPRKG